MSVKCLLSLHSKLSCRQTRDKNRSARRCKKKKKKGVNGREKTKNLHLCSCRPTRTAHSKSLSKKKQLELQTVWVYIQQRYVSQWIIYTVVTATAWRVLMSPNFDWIEPVLLLLKTCLPWDHCNWGWNDFNCQLLSSAAALNRVVIFVIAHGVIPARFPKPVYLPAR